MVTFRISSTDSKVRVTLHKPWTEVSNDPNICVVLVKLPQIIKVLRASSVEGLNTLSFITELVTQTGTFSYSSARGFPFRSVLILESVSGGGGGGEMGSGGPELQNSRFPKYLTTARSGDFHSGQLHHRKIPIRPESEERRGPSPNIKQCTNCPSRCALSPNRTCTECHNYQVIPGNQYLCSTHDLFTKLDHCFRSTDAKYIF